MFDIGGPELFLIIIMAIIVIGPKELPGAIRTVTAVIRKARGLAADFRSGLDEMVRESELNEIKQDIQQGLDPDEFENSIKADLKETLDPDEDFDGAFDFEGDWYGPGEEDGAEVASKEDGDPEEASAATDAVTDTDGAPPEEKTATVDPAEDEASRKRSADAAS